MSENKKQEIMTAEGVKKLEDELEYLRTVKRVEIKEKLKVARSYGDLSENAEYDEAKNEQAFLETRIANLETRLRNAIVVDESELDSTIVNVGSTVKVKDYEYDEVIDFKIVGSAEANPMEFKISNESPVGSALIGRKAGEIIEVIIPDGINKYEILEITR